LPPFVDNSSSRQLFQEGFASSSKWFLPPDFVRFP
jgi:hypothetical protein